MRKKFDLVVMGRRFPISKAEMKAQGHLLVSGIDPKDTMAALIAMKTGCPHAEAEILVERDGFYIDRRR